MTTGPLTRAVVLLTLIVPSIGHGSSKDVADAGYEEFVRLAKEGKKTEARELGGQLFRTLVIRKPDSAAVVLLTKRLDAVQRIDALVAEAVRPSQTRLLNGIAGMDDLGVASLATENRDVPVELLPSAQELYWTHLGLFTGAPALNGVSPQQVAFLGQFYDLQMQDAIMRIGRRVAVADPDSLEHTGYAMVLPLLHLHGRDNAWDQMESFLALFSPYQLDVAWRFSLLQAERPQASVQIARYQAGTTGKEFSLTVWAPVAANACFANHRPDLAEKLLSMAVSGAKDRDTAAELRLKLVEGYARCGDYAAAAQTCRQIASDLPDVSLYGRIMTTYFGCLAREAEADRIVTETEPALKDLRCKPYLPQILYLRWWALCKVNRQDEAVRIAHQLIEQHPGNPCVAPVLLERATDALVRQQYGKCCELLRRLTRDFPDTESAKRARDILTRLESSEVK